MATRARRQYPSVYTEIFSGTAALNAADLADGAGEVLTITVPGVALGDHVLSYAWGVSTAGLLITPYVSAANTVSFRLQNETTANVNLASTNVTVVVGRINPELAL